MIPKSKRDREVRRCNMLNIGRPRQVACSDNRCSDKDLCTWGHRGHDLPPHCLHFSRGNCRNEARCWFNHLRYDHAEVQAAVCMRMQQKVRPLASGLCDDDDDDDDDDVVVII